MQSSGRATQNYIDGAADFAKRSGWAPTGWLRTQNPQIKGTDGEIEKERENGIISN